jgi:hypothetical protein
MHARISHLALAAGLLAAAAGAAPEPAGTNRYLFVSDGRLRVGIDLQSGGAICHVSRGDDRSNLINHYDRGRFIQQSYYGNRDGSSWADKPWRWNPVQGGDYRGKPARILALSNDTTWVWCRSVPVHWATGAEIADAVMEEDIRIVEGTARVIYRFRYDGTEKHPATDHEVPAVFVDAACSNLVFYAGDAPWTGDKVSRRIPGWPNEGAALNENWAAYLDRTGRGLGIYVPGVDRMTCYRYVVGSETGPDAPSCSYFAPLVKFAITPGLDHRYELFIHAGPLTDIRAMFARIRNARNRGAGTADTPAGGGTAGGGT